MEGPSVDAYAPAQIAARIHDTGVAKARLPALQVLPLAVLAGAFIGLGAAFSTLSVTGLEIGYGLNRVVAGLAFSLGLILVIEAGAELFTGNNLIAMAWASRSIRSGELLRSWLLVFPGNFVGAVGTAALALASGVWKADDGEFGALAVRIAAAKSALPFGEASFRGELRASGAGLEALAPMGLLRNLVPVTLGNIVGGTGLVAGVYWLVYLRPTRR